MAIEAPWRIELFGGLRAIQGDRIVTRFRARKSGLLLAYLASHLSQQHPREVLIELLWAGSEPSLGRNNLSKELTALRHLFEPPGVPAGAVLRADRRVVGLNPASVTCDAAQFDAAVQSAARARTGPERRRWLSEAVELYQGEFLPGCFEEWVLQERLRLAEGCFQAARQLRAALEQAGDREGALRMARQAARLDPLREEAARDLMRLLAARDEPGAALRHYAQLEQRLAREMGTPPESETRDLARELARHVSALPAAAGRAERRERPAKLATGAHEMPVALPTGTMTFLLVECPEDAASPAPEETGAGARRWWEWLRPVLRGHGGIEVEAGGETLLFLFGRASDALAAALNGRAAAHKASRFASEVHIALHAGEVNPGAGVRQSRALEHAARLLPAVHPGQILLTEAVAALLAGGRAGAPRLTELGRYRLGPRLGPEQLYQADEPGAAGQSFPPPRALPAPLGSLPLSFTRFFGREEEITRLHDLLHSPDTRLVTLTGPGGSGKTRLALEVAARVQEPVQGRAPACECWFVPLADVADAARIVDKVLAALRVPRSPRAEPLDQAAAVLARQPSLLLLDNFEHLAEAGASLVQALLERAPSLTCMVTSRRRLNLEAEHEFPIAPLPVPGVQAFGRSGVQASGPARIEPEPEHDPNTEHRTPEHLNARTPERLNAERLDAERLDAERLNALVQCPSVRLFQDRAQKARPDFQLTLRNAAAVAELCRQLEGIPLAIELAAARAQVLTPKQMLAHLARRFDLLISRRRGASERHGSLRATLGWSFDLLPPELQRFFARLSVFRGGWDLEAAQAIRSDNERPAVDYLAELQESSLIMAEEQGEAMRWRMLETIREFAGEQLTAEEQIALRERHLQHYLALAEAASDRFESPELGACLNVMEAEHDNLRTALAWSLETADSGQWLVGRPAKTRSKTELPLSELTTNHHPLPTAGEAGLRLAGALQGLWVIRGHWSEGRRWLEVALVQAPATARTAARARALRGAGWLAEVRRDYETARPLLEESVAIYRELGDKRGAALSLHWLGWVMSHLGDDPAAVAIQKERCALSREIGDRWLLASSLHSLGVVMGPRTAEGRALLEESLAIARELEHSWVVAANLSVLAALERLQGNDETARALLEECLVERRRLDHQEGTARALLDLGALALERADWAAARAHLRQSLAIHRDLGLKGRIAACLEGAGRVAAACGQPERAARLLGATDALCEATRCALEWPFHDPAARERHVSTVRAALGEPAFAAAYAEGKVFSLDQVIGAALSEFVPPLEDEPRP